MRQKLPRKHPASQTTLNSLTPRETDVVRGLCAAHITRKSRKELAAHLGMSESTLDTHMTRIYRKLQCKNIAEIVLKVKSAL